MLDLTLMVNLKLVNPENQWQRLSTLAKFQFTDFGHDVAIGYMTPLDVIQVQGDPASPQQPRIPRSGSFTRLFTATFTARKLPALRPNLHKLSQTVYELPESEQEDSTVALFYLNVIDCSGVDYIINGFSNACVAFDSVAYPVTFFKGEIGRVVCIGDGMSVMPDVACNDVWRHLFWAKNRSCSYQGKINNISFS